MRTLFFSEFLPALGSGDFATIMEWADAFRRMEAGVLQGADGSLWIIGPP